MQRRRRSGRIGRMGGWLLESAGLCAFLLLCTTYSYCLSMEMKGTKLVSMEFRFLYLFALLYATHFLAIPIDLLRNVITVSTVPYLPFASLLLHSSLFKSNNTNASARLRLQPAARVCPVTSLTSARSHALQWQPGLLCTTSCNYSHMRWRCWCCDYKSSLVPAHFDNNSCSVQHHGDTTFLRHSCLIPVRPINTSYTHPPSPRSKKHGFLLNRRSAPKRQKRPLLRPRPTIHLQPLQGQLRHPVQPAAPLQRHLLPQARQPSRRLLVNPQPPPFPHPFTPP